MRVLAAHLTVVIAFLLSGCGAAATVGQSPAPRLSPLPTWTPSFRPIPRLTPAPSATPVAATLPVASFGFIFTYGTCVPSRVDTFAGTFYRGGTGVDAPVTVSLSLTAADLERIQRAVNEIDFLSYPATFAIQSPRGAATTMITPADHYLFQIREGARQRTVRWDDSVIGVPSEKADQLRALADLIERTVHGVPAVAALPPLHVGCA